MALSNSFQHTRDMNEQPKSIDAPINGSSEGADLESWLDACHARANRVKKHNATDNSKEVSDHVE